MFRKLLFLVLFLCASYAYGKPKNVLFVIIDDLRPNINCYGDTVAITPNINRLAAQSTLFERAYCQYPICNPSRCSVMSGMRPDTTGIYENSQTIERTIPSALTLNKYFMENDYTVVGMGKIYHASDGGPSAWTKPYIASEWLDYVEPGHKAIGDDYFTPRRKPGQQVPASAEWEDVDDRSYCDGLIADHALKELEVLKKEDKPFFLCVGFRHPHLPWNAPKKYWDFYDRNKFSVAENQFFPKGSPEVAIKVGGELFGYADIPDGEPLSRDLQLQSIHAYYACVSYVDAQLGKLLDKLKVLELENDTVVILWGDHGYQLGEHDVWAKGVGWETNTRAPLIIKVPGKGKSAQRSSKLVEFVDIYPTVCEAVGLDVPEHCDGKSLMPLLQNPMGDWDKYAFTQFKNKDFIGRTLVSDEYYFTTWQKGEEVVAKELYDRRNDPKGNFNIANEEKYKEIVSSLSSDYKVHWPRVRK